MTTVRMQVFERPRRGLARAVVLATATMSLHCGSTGGEASEPVAAGSDRVVRRTVHAGEQADVLVLVEPNASCTLRGGGLDELRVLADTRGVAAFFVAADQVGVTFELSLICSDKTRARALEYPVQVAVVPDSDETSAPTAWLDELPFPGELKAPLMEDPETVTPARLLELGLPAKPDRAKSPDAYAAWLAKVRAPVVEVEANQVDSELLNGITEETGNVWCGFVTGYLEGVLDGRHDAVSAQWAVPVVNVPALFATGKFYVSMWVGLGGYFSTGNVGFPQTGTAAIATCTRGPLGNLCGGTYSAWVEYFNDTQIAVPSLPVRVGHVIQAQVTMVNGMGQFDPYGTSALMRLTDTSVSPPLTTWATLALPDGRTFYADSAEWILERPQQADGTLLPFAKFSDFVMQNTQGTITGSDFLDHTVMYGDSGVNTKQLTLINAFNTTLAQASTGPASPSGQTMTVHWLASK